MATPVTKRSQPAVPPTNGTATGPYTLDLARLRPRILKMQAVEQSLNTRMIERDPINHLFAVSLLAQANVILFGPRGTGKSYHAQQVVRCIAGARHFWKPMDKYSTPEEIYGKLNLGLLQNGIYEHIISDTLLDCHVAFLDEYLESGAPLLKTLLGVLNERTFKNGTRDLQLPLMMAVAATNQQFTAAQAPDADRWLNKAIIVPLSAAGRYELRLRDAGLAGPLPPLATIPLDELLELQAAVPAVQIPRSLIDHLTTIDQKLGDGPGGLGIIISDRRARQMLMMVRASALLAGRGVADEDDLSILQYALWEDPKQYNAVAAVVGAIVNPLNQQAKDLLDSCVQTRDATFAAARGIANRKERGSLFLEAWGKTRRVQDKQLTALAAQARGDGRDDAQILRAIEVLKPIVIELRDAALSDADLDV